MPSVTTYDIYKYDYTVADWPRLRHPDYGLQQKVAGRTTRHDTVQRSSQQHTHLELSSHRRTSVDTVAPVPRIPRGELQGIHTLLPIVKHFEQSVAGTRKVQRNDSQQG